MRIAKMLTIAASTCALLLAMAWTSTVTAQVESALPRGLHRSRGSGGELLAGA